MDYLFASATPCRATAAGCPHDNLIGVVLILGLVGFAVMGVLAWIWTRWGRGPFPMLMNIFGRFPTWRKRK
jgi:hypothetical protein